MKRLSLKLVMTTIIVLFTSAVIQAHDASLSSLEEQNNTTIKVTKIKIPQRMPRNRTLIPIKLSTGIVNIVFESDFTDVQIFIFKDGIECLYNIYPAIEEGTILTYDFNIWNNGSFTLEITTNDGITITKSIEY